MRPQRLSYEIAGRAAQPHTAPRPPLPTVAPASAQGTIRYGHSPTQARQRRLVIATMLLMHGLAVVGLLNASRLRDIVVEAKPMFVAVVDAPPSLAPPRPLPPPPALKLPPPQTLPVIAPEPSPAPPTLLAQAVATPPPAPAMPVAAAPQAAPAPSLPKTIPPSAVQYLEPPAPAYSRMSARMHESGQAIVRVYIDESGLPRSVELARSTGFSRLDDSALAAVRNCRFKPYLENGAAVAGWALIPIEFELPK